MLEHLPASGLLDHWALGVPARAQAQLRLAFELVTRVGFGKLGINSRRELALAAEGNA